jgi:hypothetical protein
MGAGVCVRDSWSRTSMTSGHKRREQRESRAKKLLGPRNFLKNRVRIVMCAIVMVGFVLASSGCHEWNHWDRHGYDQDDSRYDRNDRRGWYGDIHPDRGYAR